MSLLLLFRPTPELRPDRVVRYAPPSYLTEAVQATASGGARLGGPAARLPYVLAPAPGLTVARRGAAEIGRAGRGQTARSGIALTVSNEVVFMRLLKDPDETLDVTLHWHRWLRGASIRDAQWTITPLRPATGRAVVVAEQRITGTDTTAWLWGGADGDEYELTCHVTADETPERSRDQSFHIRVRQT